MLNYRVRFSHNSSFNSSEIIYKPLTSTLIVLVNVSVLHTIVIRTASVDGGRYAICKDSWR